MNIYNYNITTQSTSHILHISVYIINNFQTQEDVFNNKLVPILGTVAVRPWLLPFLPSVSSVLMFHDSASLMIQIETLLADTELKTVWMIDSMLLI